MIGYRQGSDCQENKDFREELKMYELPTGPSDIEQHDLVSLQDYGDSQIEQLKRKRDVKAEEKATRGRPIEKYDDFLREKRLTIKNLEDQITDK